MTFKTGDKIGFDYSGERYTDGVITLVSKNQNSMMIARTDGLIASPGGFVNALPILKDEGGIYYRDIIFNKVCVIHKP